MALEIIGRGITKFDGSDFQTWKFEVRQLLITHGLESIVDGTRPKPAGNVANAAVTIWIKENAKAMSVIASSLEREQLRGLTTCTTANDMWQTLTAIYEQRSASSKLLLLQKYHEYRMKSGDSVIQHVTNVQKLASQLKDVGQDITELDVMAKILGSLPPKYSTLATAWDSVPVTEQKVGVLFERLNKEESRMTEEDNATSALAVLNLKEKKNSVSDVSKDKKYKKKNSYSSKASVECFYCKKRGHYARDCRKKKRGETYDSHKNSSDNSAFVVTVFKIKDDKAIKKCLSNDLIKKIMNSDVMYGLLIVEPHDISSRVIDRFQANNW